MVSEYVSSQLKIDNNYLFNISSSSSPTSTCTSIQNNLPILNCDGTYTKYGELNTTNPTSLFANTICKDSVASLKADCISMFVRPITNGGAITSVTGLSRVDAARLYIKVRTGCRGSLSRCRYTSYQETFRAKNFFDFMYYLQYTTLDPNLYTANVISGSTITSISDAIAKCADKQATSRDAGCVNVSFTNKDAFNSNAQFFTEDYYYYFCGDVNNLSNNQILSQAGGTSAISYLTDSSCLPSSSRESQFTNVSQTNTIGGLPGTNASDSAKILMTQSAGNTAVLSSGICTYKTLTSNSSFNYSSGVVSIDGTPISALTSCAKIIIFANIDSNSSFHIIGNNTIDKQISIVSSGSIQIDGDTSYPSSPGTSLLSLTAENGIIIASPAAGCSGSSCDKTISAYMFSAKSTIKVENWDGATDPGYAASGVQPTLHFKGAIVGKYQPVFGSFNGNDGTLYSGYVKDLNFDDRVKNGSIYIPYIIDPKVPQWDKFELVEIASTSTP